MGTPLQLIKQFGTKAKFEDAVDNPEIRQAVLTVLDGGREAFDLRKRKYGF